MTKEEIVERVGANSTLWATCEHKGVTATDHRCPHCGGTLRRCCDSLVGYYEHRASCAEVLRRTTDVA